MSRRAVSICLLVAGLVGSSGCASWQLPRSGIDPSGRRIFLPPGSPPQNASPAPIAAGPPVAAARAPVPGLSLHPARIIAPVGSEVVLVASVCGEDGYMLSGQRVEWSLAPGGVGHLVSVGEREPLDVLSCALGLPKKVDNTFAVNSTRWSYFVVDRGTPTPVDDVPVQPGQAWASISSPVEGTSYVTAHAPAVPAWDRHKPTAAVHWVDVQFAFPPPAISPAGSRHSLATEVVRQSDSSPLPGWGVRYEIVGGPDAVFTATNSTIAEVPTDSAGQATVEITQPRASPGTNRINIQVIRPADPRMGQRIVVGNGGVLQTWTAAGLVLRVSGPRQARVGETITYRIDAINSGGAAASDVVITDRPARGLSFVNASPAADSSPSGQEWRLGTIGPGQQRTIEANFRAEQPGRYQLCAAGAAGGQTTSQECATTEVLPAGPPIVDGAMAALQVDVSGPTTARVGDTVDFTVTIVNRGTRAARQLSITSRFDEGLQFAEGKSPLERDLDDLAPGQTRRVGLRYRAIEAGNQCQQIEVRGEGGLFRSARACVRVSPAASAGPPAERPDERSPADTAGRKAVETKLTADRRRAVGETAEFKISIINTGEAALENVQIVFTPPVGAKPSEATEDFQKSAAGDITWRVDRLAAGRTLHRQVNCTCEQPTREACGRVSVRADGVPPVADQWCVEIVRAGAARDEDAADAAAGRRAEDGRLTIAVSDIEDPVRVGAKVTYQIVVTNGTGVSQRDVTLVVASSDDLRFVQGKGPTACTEENRRFRFEPVAEMRAGETLKYEVTVETSKRGTSRVSAEVTSRQQRAPLAAEQTTQVLERN